MADTASHTLNDLRKKIRATENSIRDRLESMVRNMDTSKYLQESVVSIRNGRYVVPVKSEYRGEVSGIIHDVSSTGATVFVEPQAVETILTPITEKYFDTDSAVDVASIYEEVCDTAKSQIHVPVQL